MGAIVPSHLAAIGGACAVAALALFAGCLVFDGKVATDDGSSDSGSGTPDASNADGGIRDAAQGFCASQRGSEPIVCLDFDEATSAVEVFGAAHTSTSGGGVLSLDAPDGGPPPPSLPNALDVFLPGSDGGSAATGTVAFGPITNGVECTFEALYDQGAGYGQLLDIQLQGPALINAVDFLVSGTTAHISGFFTEGGAVYVNNAYSYVWTIGTWVAVDFKIDLTAHSLTLTFNGMNYGGNATFPDMGTIGGGDVLLGYRGSPTLLSEMHVDNVLCHKF